MAALAKICFEGGENTIGWTSIRELETFSRARHLTLKVGDCQNLELKALCAISYFYQTLTSLCISYGNFFVRPEPEMIHRNLLLCNSSEKSILPARRVTGDSISNFCHILNGKTLAGSTFSTKTRLARGRSSDGSSALYK